MTRLNVTRTPLDGVLLIEPPTAFEDFRGRFVEVYNERLYREAGIDVHFVQDDYSISSRHVLRGIHGDSETYKLISCPVGRIHLVIVNLDTQSRHYRRWLSFDVTESKRVQVLAPPKSGVAHLVMSDMAMLHYKQSTYYNRASQFTAMWNDPALGIWWPISDPILSRRDAGLDEQCVTNGQST